jgi:hypothetical protein
MVKNYERKESKNGRTKSKSPPTLEINGNRFFSLYSLYFTVAIKAVEAYSSNTSIITTKDLHQQLHTLHAGSVKLNQRLEAC